MFQNILCENFGHPRNPPKNEEGCMAYAMLRTNNDKAKILVMYAN